MEMAELSVASKMPFTPQQATRFLMGLCSLPRYAARCEEPSCSSGSEVQSSGAWRWVALQARKRQERPWWHHRSSPRLWDVPRARIPYGNMNATWA